jgi:site-specific recombinase XerD
MPAVKKTKSSAKRLVKLSAQSKVNSSQDPQVIEAQIDIDSDTGEVLITSSEKEIINHDIKLISNKNISKQKSKSPEKRRSSSATKKNIYQRTSSNKSDQDQTVEDQLPQAPPTKIEELYSSAQAFAEQAKSPQTKRAYQSDWNDFALWCQRHNLHPMPATPQCIALYLTEKSESLKISSLRRRLTAISQVHKMQEVEFNAAHVAIRSVWAGIRRAKGTAAEGKAPVRVDDLKLIIFTRPNTLRGLRDIALISLGFSGAFRRSELVSLNHGDLEFVPEGLKINLRRSKTDQEGAGMVKSVPFGQNPKTCCVRSVQRWLQASDIQSGPIFRPINRHGQIRPRRLTGHAVATLLKDALSESLRSQGIPELRITDKVAKFSGHSLRAGYVTSAAAEGAEEHIIMRQTGHKRVDTVRRYIREGDLFRNHPLEKMGI